MAKKLTQYERILLHLQKRGSITPLQAMQLYGVSRLDNRIRELRKKGHVITCTHADRVNKYLEDFKMPMYTLQINTK